MYSIDYYYFCSFFLIYYHFHFCFAVLLRFIMYYMVCYTFLFLCLLSSPLFVCDAFEWNDNQQKCNKLMLRDIEIWKEWTDILKHIGVPFWMVPGDHLPLLKIYSIMRIMNRFSFFFNLLTILYCFWKRINLVSQIVIATIELKTEINGQKTDSILRYCIFFFLRMNVSHFSFY